MTSRQPFTADQAADLTNCDQEPIHIPGTIQPHGFLLAFEAHAATQLRVVVASENAQAFLGRSQENILGTKLEELLPSQIVDSLQKGLLSEGASREVARFIGTVQFGGSDHPNEFQIIGHRVHDLYLLEFEETQRSVGQAELNTVISNFVSALEAIRTPAALCDAITLQVRELTGFDRVMLYEFDEVGHGTVLSESRNDRLPSYLGLRFPASDIPRQARALYVLNRIRIIPNVEYQPSPLVAIPSYESEGPLDLSLSTLRSVSPIHLDYMRNMGTISSMSVSIVMEGRLWGLISAHHSEPRQVSYLIRSACDVLSRIMSAQLAASRQSRDLAHAIRLKSVHSQLLTYMASGENYIDGLARHPNELCAVTGAAGAAIIVSDRCVLLNQTPPESAVISLSSYLAKSLKDEVFVSSEVVQDLPTVELDAKGAGVLAISLSQIHRMQIIWFRPEVIESVQWAGEPIKVRESVDGVLQIHPRNSFASWKEIVRGKADPWTTVEVDSAKEFRNSVLEIVLRRAEELADMAAELEFSNRELEAFSYSVSHDLRAPFRHISGFAELLLKTESAGLSDKGHRYVTTIVESAQFAGLLVDSLLNFSRISRVKMEMQSVDMKTLIDDVWRDVVKQELEGRSIDFRNLATATVQGDVNLLRQVIRNLLSNAAKYTRTQSNPRITFDSTSGSGESTFSVADNGVGFDNAYAHKLFGAFQRLHRMEEFEGTGIGLANVRRIISRMGGRTWAEGRLNEGATFWFTIPIKHP